MQTGSVSFIQHNSPLWQAYAPDYQWPWLLLAVGLSLLTAWLTWQHGRLLRAAGESRRRYLWWCSGAVVLGLGAGAVILAATLSLDISVTRRYAPGTLWLIFLLPALAGAGIPWLLLQGRPPGSSVVLVTLGLLAAVLLASHQALQAQELAARIRILPVWFWLSVALGALFCWLALAARLQVAEAIPAVKHRRWLATGLLQLALLTPVLGLVLAVVYLPDSHRTTAPVGWREAGLENLVLGIAFILVLLTLMALWYVRRFPPEQDPTQRRTRGKVTTTERLEEVVRDFPGVMFELERDRAGQLTFTYVSNAVHDVFRTSPDQDLTGPVANLLSYIEPSERDAFTYTLADSARNLQQWHYEFRLEQQPDDLAETWVLAEARPHRAAGGRVVWRGFFSDISEQKEKTAAIRKMAYYDALTGLPGRRMLAERIDSVAGACGANQFCGFLLMVNLDEFKKINDVHGQQTGDELLKVVAERLAELAPDDVLVSRITADEFGLFAEQLGKNTDLAKTAEALAETVKEQLSQLFKVKDLHHRSGASIGIAYLDGSGLDADEVLRRADIAVNQAKKEGGHRWRSYDREIEKQIKERHQLAQDLSEALRRDEMEVHYQVQVDQQGLANGGEALLRWNHGRQGRVSPGVFIPLAEESGYIMELGRWVLRQACEQLGYWQRDTATAHLSISVNVSARQFYQDNFVNTVLSDIKEFGVRPDRLKLELTESLVLEDVDGVISKMQELQAHGVRFSMDDFGTGYSSLSYLSLMPFNEVKIDQAFVRRAASEINEHDWLIIDAIISIGSQLNMDIIAEGIETETQWDRLADMGCQRFQGYFFGKPEPAVQFVNNIRNLL